MMGPSGAPTSTAQSLLELAALLTDKGELESRVRMLSDQERASNVARDAAEKRLTEAMEVERRVSAREVDVGKRESAVERREAKAAAKEAEIAKLAKSHADSHASRSAVLENQADDLAKREAVVAKREKDLDERMETASRDMRAAEIMRATWEEKMQKLKSAVESVSA